MPGDEDSLPPPIPKITPANTPYVLCSSCTAAPVTLIEQWLVHVAICVALAEANSDDSAGALRGNTTVLHETDGSKRYSRDGDSACVGEDDIYVLWPRHLPRQRRLRLGLGYSNCTLADFTEAGCGPEDQLPFELYSFEDCREWLHPVFGEGAGPAISSTFGANVDGPETARQWSRLHRHFCRSGRRW